VIKILQNFQLKSLTTFGTGGIGRRLYLLKSLELPNILGKIDKFLVLGNGSNVIFSDDYFTNNILYIIPLSASEGINIDSDLIEVDANVSSSALAWWCAKNGISGFEFAAGIPGRVGASVAGNAGCFGSDFSNKLKKIFVYDCNSKSFYEINADDIQFSYRKSSIKDKIILKAYFEINYGKSDYIYEQTMYLLSKKKFNQPLGIRTFGSIFKNPPGDSAGRLLDSLGFKEYVYGGVRVSDKHANFLENISGTSSDAVKLIKLMQTRVLESFNILLEPEIKFLGNFKELPMLSGDN
jgi:UDP-N-acetylmuramate dehydrogenase